MIHPLDVIRTRIQTDKSNSGIPTIIRNIYNTRGMLGFYAGFTPPLAAQAVYKAVVFSSNGLSRRIILSRKPDGNKTLSTLEHSICGAIAGMVNSSVVCPVELIRNRLIVASQNRTNIYKGPVDCLKQVWTSEGIPGLYRGWTATMLRDAPGLAAWFTAFETARKTIPKVTGLNENDDLTILASGSCGGVTFWTVALPMDAIKSRIQTSYGNQNNIEMLVKVIKDKGILRFIRDLYRGYPIAVARGIPASAIVFFVNQRATTHLQQLF